MIARVIEKCIDKDALMQCVDLDVVRRCGMSTLGHDLGVVVSDPTLQPGYAVVRHHIADQGVCCRRSR